MKEISVGSLWRKRPTASVWGGEVVVVAVTKDFVIICNKHISTFFTEYNKESSVSRTKFEAEYATTDEARRLIHEACQSAIASTFDSLKPRLGSPVRIHSNAFGGETYLTSNGLTIRFTSMGHYYVNVPEGSLNPVSSHDAAWIANKSAELRRNYDAHEAVSRTYTRWGY